MYFSVLKEFSEEVFYFLKEEYGKLYFEYYFLFSTFVSKFLIK